MEIAAAQEKHPCHGLGTALYHKTAMPLVKRKMINKWL
jgi:hypothetical protein